MVPPTAGKGRYEVSRSTSIIRMAAVSALASAMAMLADAQVALADIHAGDTTITGYKPDEIVTTDMTLGSGDMSQVAPTISQKLVQIVTAGLPILAVISVGIIIYNAVYNALMPDEDPHEAMKSGRRVKRPMGEVLRSIFVMFFFILFAWVIVELIIYAVTSLEVFTQQTLSAS